MSNAANQSTTKGTLPIIVGAESEVGLREENQDHMTGFLSAFGAIYVIADGMGGHRGGAEASRMVIEGVRTRLQEPLAGVSLHAAIEQAARLTNDELFQKSKSGDPNYAGMGSTLSLIVLSEAASGVELVTAHVGDSRVYLQRGGQLLQLTKDHTYVQRLVDSNAIDEEAARTHPDASVLTRAMGQAQEVAVDISEPIPLIDGDGILLCSDGLSGYAATATIEETLRQNPGPADGAKALVNLALKSGSDDNITVQFVRLGNSPTAVSRAPVKRLTQPESEALPPIPPDEARKTSLRSGWLHKPLLWAGLALALLSLGAGLYIFRHALFPPRITVPDPAAEQKRHAQELLDRAVALHTRALQCRNKVQEEIDSAPPEPARTPQGDKLTSPTKRLAALRGRLDDSFGESNKIGESASGLRDRLNRKGGVGSQPAASKGVGSEMDELTAKLNDCAKKIEAEEAECRNLEKKAPGKIKNSTAQRGAPR